MRLPKRTCRDVATVLRARICSPVDDAQLRTYLDHVRREIEWLRGRRLVTDPSGLPAAFDGPVRAIRCARALIAAAARFGFDPGIGLRTGECAVSEGRMSGIAAEVAARLAEIAGGSEVFVSRTVRDLVAGSGLEFADHDVHVLGVGGPWRLSQVVDTATVLDETDAGTGV